MYKNKILIVEDNPLIAMEIKISLIDMDYTVTSIEDCYDDALKSIKKELPHLILIDIGLKGQKDGISLAKSIQANYDIPFIYLTSDMSEDTIDKACETNPAHYLPKPYTDFALNMAIRLILNKSRRNNFLEDIGENYFYNAFYKKLYLGKKCINLTPIERKILEILIENKNKLIGREIIEDYIWGSTPISAENLLRTNISRLRKKIKPLEIKVTKGEGYTLILKG